MPPIFRSFTLYACAFDFLPRFIDLAFVSCCAFSSLMRFKSAEADASLENLFSGRVHRGGLEKNGESCGFYVLFI